MQHDISGHAKAPTTPGFWQREVDAGWQHIGEAVERERGLVRHHTAQLGPQPCGDELLVLACREMNEAVDTAAYADGLARVEVVHEELGE